jgi:hypothetical protein
MKRAGRAAIRQERSLFGVGAIICVGLAWSALGLNPNTLSGANSVMFFAISVFALGAAMWIYLGRENREQ